MADWSYVYNICIKDCTVYQNSNISSSICEGSLKTNVIFLSYMIMTRPPDSTQIKLFVNALVYPWEN